MTNTDDTKSDATHTSVISLSCSHKPINAQPERTPMLTKRCTKCQTDKDVAEFSPMKGGKYGVSSWCKSCHRDDQRQRRQARATMMSNARPQADEFVPNILPIPIRSDLTVKVANIPADLTREEANRIERIVKAFADDDPTVGEGT